MKVPERILISLAALHRYEILDVPCSGTGEVPANIEFQGRRLHALPFQPRLRRHMGYGGIPRADGNLPIRPACSGQRIWHHWLGYWCGHDHVGESDHVQRLGGKSLPQSSKFLTGILTNNKRW